MNKKFALSGALIVSFLVFVFTSSQGIFTSSPSGTPQADTQTQSPTTASSFDTGSAAVNAGQSPTPAPPPSAAPSYAQSDDDLSQTDEEGERPSVPAAKQQAPAPTPKPVVKPAPAPVAAKPKGKYKDGTYTGASIDVYYGIVQVQVTVSGGKITDVQFLSYPNDRQRSIQIAQRAMPILKSEAISTQKAPVSAVSGASATSDGFNQSLTSALSQAGA